MASGNSKLILLIVAAIVVVGIIATRSLAPSGEKRESSREDSETKAPTNAGTEGDKPRVQAIGNAERRQGAANSPRSFERGDGATRLEVTPATTTPQQMAALVQQMDDDDDDEPKDEATEIADLVKRFRAETDPEIRIDIADELGLIDNPEGMRQVLELLKTETDPEVQVALLEALQGLEALEITADEVFRTVSQILENSTDIDVRTAAQDVLGEIGSPEATELVRQMFNNTNADPQERLNAAYNMMAIKATEPDRISDEEFQAVNDRLKLDYQAGPDGAFRAQAISALAINGYANLGFFQQALQTETDPQVRALLERLINAYSAPPPQMAPPGTQVTPVPTMAAYE